MALMDEDRTGLVGAICSRDTGDDTTGNGVLTACSLEDTLEITDPTREGSAVGLDDLGADLGSIMEGDPLLVAPVPNPSSEASVPLSFATIWWPDEAEITSVCDFAWPFGGRITAGVGCAGFLEFRAPTELPRA